MSINMDMEIKYYSRLFILLIKLSSLVTNAPFSKVKSLNVQSTLIKIFLFFCEKSCFLSDSKINIFYLFV